jgi:RimJ/RimL family protein N-acetyltransferase
VVEAANDPVSQHWLAGLPSPYTRENALTYIHDREEEAAAGRGVHWASAPVTGGAATGSFSLMGLQAHDGGGEIGYWVHPAVRGTGVATEAVTLMIAHAFAPKSEGGLGLRRLTVAHVTGNDASRKVIERAGFRPFGVERAAERLRGGTIVDLHWYDLLTDDLSE